MSDVERQDLTGLLKDDIRKVSLLAEDISNNYLGDMIDTHNLDKDERTKFARNLEWDYNRYSVIMAILRDQIDNISERVNQL
jgi:hypothetical protein